MVLELMNSSPGQKPPRPLFMAGFVLFCLLLSCAVLLAVNTVIEWLEDADLITTLRGVDDQVQYVDRPLFERTNDEYRTTRYAASRMVPSRFKLEKRDGWRMFILGGSFAMGTPYTHQDHNEERPGGISSWLRENLGAMNTGQSIEIINAAAGAQDSNRVKAIAEQVVDFEPDALLVATCNNEGNLPPHVVTQTLRKYGGIRLMNRLLKPSPAIDERPRYTSQHPDIAAVRSAFRTNLRTILQSAERRGITVLLCTLPVNLRYEDDDVGHTVGGVQPEVEAGNPGCAIGKRLYLSGKFRDAIKQLETSEQVEALRWVGLSHYALGQFDRAYVQLSTYAEMVPRNRCRPSFNEIIREEARAISSAVLVDLETHAERCSPHGIPGPELFVDYCHLNWRGYALMAEEILQVMKRRGFGPGNMAGWDGPMEHERLRKKFRLPRDSQEPL